MTVSYHDIMKVKSNIDNNTLELELFKREVMDRIESMFSSRSTWSAWPVAEYDMIKAIEQIIEDQTNRLKTNIKQSK